MLAVLLAAAIPRARLSGQSGLPYRQQQQQQQQQQGTHA
jgi:hypothetical protein